MLADNPVAYYQLSDTGATMSDSGPNGFNGTLGSSVVHNVQSMTSEPNFASGFPGGAYSTNGIGSVTPSTNMQTSSLSIETWVQQSSLNSTHTDIPFVAYGSNPSYTYELMISSTNGIRFRIHTASAIALYSVYGKTVLQPGKVYHVVATYDGTTASVYVNGGLDGSTSATGALKYVTIIPGAGGLVAGGAFGETGTLFNGDLEDVSIYQSALAASDVLAHYNAGLATPALHETPGQSDGFVDTIGVNTHFHYQQSAYYSQYSAIEPLLVASGIRHIREQLVEPNWLGYYTELNQLAAAGIHSLLTMSLSNTQADVATLPSQYYSSSMEAFEGPNEVDESGDPNWVTDLRTFQEMAYPTLKANPATAKLPVYAPNIVNPGNATTEGSLASYVDNGNIHDYFGDYNPGNPGYGSIGPFGYYGCVSYFENFEAQVSGSKPFVSTETGYPTGGVTPMSTLADDKYGLRTYFVHFNDGVLRTYRYELLDEMAPTPPSQGISGFNYMGLLDSNLQPKPLYNSVKGLIGTLSDKGTAFSATPLTYTLAGSITNLDHTLLQKRNGTYMLALWLEVPSWNVTTQTDITVPAQSVQLRLPFNPSSASVTTFNSSGNPSNTALSFTSGTASVPVADQIVLVQFHS
ncbi:MAG: LamG domain-containing protein [Vulcanimicrobiaceae bacterium]